MYIPIKPLGLLSKKQQDYLKRQKLEFFNGSVWVKYNSKLRNYNTYRVRRKEIKNLRELQDYTQQFLSEEYPFVAMDKDGRIFKYKKKPYLREDHYELFCDEKLYRIISSEKLDISNKIDWRESLSSLHPMED